MRISASLGSIVMGLLVTGAASAAEIPVSLTTTLDSARGVTLVANPVDGVGPSAAGRLRVDGVRAGGSMPVRDEEVRAGGDEEGKTSGAADALGFSYPVTLRVLGADGKVLLEAGPFAVPVTKEVAKRKGNLSTGWDLEQNKKVRLAITAGNHFQSDQFAGGHVRTPYTVHVDVSGPALANLGSAVELLIGDSAEPGAPKLGNPYVLVPLDDLGFTFAGALDFGKAEPKGTQYDVVASWQDADGQPLGQPERTLEKANGQKIKGTVAYQYQPWELDSDVGEVMGVTYEVQWLLRLADNADATRDSVRFDVTPQDGGPSLDPALQPLVLTGTNGGELAVVTERAIADKDTWVFLVTPLDAAGKALGKATTLTANTAATQNVLIGSGSAKVSGGNLVTSIRSTITGGKSYKLLASGFANGTAILQLDLILEKSTGPALLAVCGDKPCGTQSILMPLTPTLEQVPMLFDQAGETAVKAASEIKPEMTWTFLATLRSATGAALGESETIVVTDGSVPEEKTFGRPRAHAVCKFWSNNLYSTPRCVVVSSVAGAYLSLEPMFSKTDGPSLTMVEPNPLGAKDAIWVPLKTTRTSLVAERTLQAGTATIAGVKPTRPLVQGDRLAFRVVAAKSEPPYYVSHAADHGARVMFVPRDLNGPRATRLSERTRGVQNGDLIEMEVVGKGTSLRLNARYVTPCDLSAERGICLYSATLPVPGAGGTSFAFAYDAEKEILDLGSLLAQGGVTGVQLVPIVDGYEVAMAGPDCKDTACTGGLVVELADLLVGYNSLMTLRYPTGTDSNTAFAYAARVESTSQFIDDWQGETGYFSLKPKGGGMCFYGKCFCTPYYCQGGDERIVGSVGGLLGKIMHDEEN
jgi:hypothetical protein